MGLYEYSNVDEFYQFRLFEYLFIRYTTNKFYAIYIINNTLYIYIVYNFIWGKGVWCVNEGVFGRL